MKLPISVAIVDDHNVLRNALKNLVSSFERVDEVFESPNRSSLNNLLNRRPVDVALISSRTKNIDTVQTCLWVSRMHPGVRVILHGVLKDEKVNHLIRFGARAVLSRTAEVVEMQEAIYAVADCGFYYNKFTHECIQEKNKNSTNLRISSRETEIIRLIVREYTSRQIADMLNISLKTVENHRSNIFHKLGVNSAIGLMKFATIHDLIEE